MPILKVFRPSITDTIDPNYTALPGQVVRVMAAPSRSDRVIATPDGEIDLGIVSIFSLYGIPSAGLVFDKETGLTREANTFVA